jgi:NodT family efflux transporter outer membrane factor (OMF) lipoprotein
MRGRTAVRAAGVLALVLGAGCTIAPQPPPTSQLQTPAAWRAQPAAGDAPAVAPHWWRAFGDARLDALVAQALAHNSDLRVARSRVAEYLARLDVAQAAQAPAVSADFAPSRSRARTATGAIAETSLLQLGAQVSYEVDLWGRLDHLSDAAVADLQGQRAAADAAALSIAATVASGYLNLRGLDAQRALAQATLASREASLARARRLYETGYTSRLEWVQAEGEYRTAAAALPALQRSIAQQENALMLLLGASPGTPDGEIARGNPLAALTPPPLAGGVPSELLRRRPDIARAEQQLVAADASLAASRDQLLPSMQLSVSGTLQGFTLDQLLRSPVHLWSVGGSLLAPVLQGRRLQAGTEVAAALRDQALIGYEQVVRTAFSEVDNALSAIAALGAQLDEARARASTANEALRIARNRYRNGYASYLEELDAQRSSYAAEQNTLQLQAALLSAYVDLYRALGGGWKGDPSTR